MNAKYILKAESQQMLKCHFECRFFVHLAFSLLTKRRRKKLKATQTQVFLCCQLAAIDSHFCDVVLFYYFWGVIFIFLLHLFSRFSQEKYRLVSVIQRVFLLFETTCFIQQNMAIIAIHNFYRKWFFISRLKNGQLTFRGICCIYLRY